MRNRKFNNLELDTIGKRLVESGALSESEIDRIAASPSLFDGVRARIALEQQPAASEKIGFASYFRQDRFAYGSAFAAVLMATVFGIYLQQNPSVHVSNAIHVPVQSPEAARSKITPQVIVKGFTQGRAEIFDEPVTEDPVVQRAIYRQPEPVGPTVQQASFRQEQTKEFYPVTYTGDGGESARGGRVIRVDVPRSTLFAMGMDLPLENESPTVKADLLIGPDGVTRAIRLVE